MGSLDGEGYVTKHPRHRVCITRPFYIDKYPVTQANWAKLMGGGGNRYEKFAGGDRRCVGHAEACRAVASELGCAFFDAGAVAGPSSVDGVHLDADQHGDADARLAEQRTEVGRGQLQVRGKRPAGSRQREPPGQVLEGQDAAAVEVLADEVAEKAHVETGVGHALGQPGQAGFRAVQYSLPK